jgi:hypothetical protein
MSLPAAIAFLGDIRKKGVSLNYIDFVYELLIARLLLLMTTHNDGSAVNTTKRRALLR